MAAAAVVVLIAQLWTIPKKMEHKIVVLRISCSILVSALLILAAFFSGYNDSFWTVVTLSMCAVVFEAGLFMTSGEDYRKGDILAFVLITCSALTLPIISIQRDTLRALVKVLEQTNERHDLTQKAMMDLMKTQKEMVDIMEVVSKKENSASK
jgi:hypothetical protein